MHDPRTSLTLVARVLYGHGARARVQCHVIVVVYVLVWAPGRIGCLCNGLYAVLSSGIVFRASFSKMKINNVVDSNI